MQGLQTSLRSNRFKTWLLILILPAVLGVVIFTVLYISSSRPIQDDYGQVIGYQEISPQERLAIAQQQTGEILLILGPILIIWLLISFFFQRKLMFSFSGAKVVTRKEEPELYNLVENLCVSQGLITPKIGIIEESWMNAFALWWRSKDSWVVFTRGLLNTLNKSEIEAVAAHELTHIINKDSLLMLVTVLYIGAVSLLWEILIRTGSSSSSDSKGKSFLPLIGIALMILGYIFYPLIRLAISRRREYLADAGSVLLTKDNQAMISALRKISWNSMVEIKNTEMASMFIANPLRKISSLFQTHPSVENRIKALENY